MQPAAETLARTPLPIYGEYTGSETLAKVVLKYKGFGMGEWKTLEMKEMDKGWGAEIPCLDVVQGDLLYYVQGFNSSNDPVATSGDRNNPYKTAVKRDFAGAALHFPRQGCPQAVRRHRRLSAELPRLQEGSAENDTPQSTLKVEGEECEEDSECDSGTCKKQKADPTRVRGAAPECAAGRLRSARSSGSASRGSTTSC